MSLFRIHCQTHGTDLTVPSYWTSYLKIGFIVNGERDLEIDPGSIHDVVHLNRDGHEVEDQSDCEIMLEPVQP